MLTVNGKLNVLYPLSLFHWEMLFEAKDEVVRFMVVVERLRVLPFQARFNPAVILLEGVW